MQLGLRIFEARVGLGDFSFQGVDLFAAHAGIDVVAVCYSRRERGTRLVRLCRQLHGRELRQDIARVYLGSLLHLDRHELAVDLRFHPDFGRPDDAHERGRGPRRTFGIDQRARDKRECDRNDDGAPSLAHVSVLS